MYMKNIYNKGRDFCIYVFKHFAGYDNIKNYNSKIGEDITENEDNLAKKVLKLSSDNHDMEEFLKDIGDNPDKMKILFLYYIGKELKKKKS